VFANHNQELWEKFEVELDEDGKVYFISCRTGRYMQCDGDGYVRCVHKKRTGWEAWRIVDQTNTDMMTSARLTTICVTGAAAVLSPTLGAVVGQVLRHH
jgi:hypothetical protein